MKVLQGIAVGARKALGNGKLFTYSSTRMIHVGVKDISAAGSTKASDAASFPFHSLICLAACR